MVGYFRKQNILFILLGALLGLLLGFLTEMGLVAKLLHVGIGGALGRLLCGIWANKQLGKWNDILFVKGEPKAFLEIFSPIMEKTSRGTLEYADGCNKLAYAWEALGDFPKAWEYLTAANPEKLGGKSGVNVMTTTCSNRVRVLLLQEKTAEAEQALEELQQVTESAILKDKHLGHAGRHYVRLYENWLLILNGENADLEFIEEEIKLSGNRIRSSELQLLLARAYGAQGDSVMAEELRLDAMSTGIGLWAERQARLLLK